ncbi:MAG: lipase family protein [Symploca sp. SIO2E9]|nr:lipase family protein [Symploca sp. SIO2E9]
MQLKWLKNALQSVHLEYDKLGFNESNAVDTYLFGHSLGGLFALSWPYYIKQENLPESLLPQQVLVAAPIPNTAAANFPGLLGKIIDKITDDVDVKVTGAELTMPVAILHGDDDWVAPKNKWKESFSYIKTKQKKMFLSFTDQRGCPAIYANHEQAAVDTSFFPPLLALTVLDGVGVENVLNWRYIWYGLDQVIRLGIRADQLEFDLGSWSDGQSVQGIEVFLSAEQTNIDEKMNYLTTAEIDHERALLLVNASIQAYNAFDKEQPTECNSEQVKTPDGYDFVECWTGVDAILNEDKTVECYGVVFRSSQSPYTYIFAFRGTDSTEDLLDDFGFNYATFSPCINQDVVPNDVKVESGFYCIYSDSDGNTESMQKQLFALIDKYQASEQPINQLYVTGHSLGAAISTLFSLDIALSRPDINSTTYNYASPRVGNQAFVDFYEQQKLQQNPETRTIRIQNVYDKVPCVPLKDQGYQHLSYAYLVSFYRDNLTGKFDIVDNHSVHSYQTVLKCAFKNESGYFEGIFDNNQGEKMQSVQPDQSKVCTYW